MLFNPGYDEYGKTNFSICFQSNVVEKIADELLSIFIGVIYDLQADDR